MRNVFSALTGAALTIAIAATSANASITFISSQAAFSAAGAIVQDTNWDSYGAGFFLPGSPFTIGDLTFVQGRQTVIGGVATSYNLARNLITDNYFLGTTAEVTGKFSLFGANAGDLLHISAPETFTITTNLGSYSFSENINAADNLAPLTFIGFEASAGEYINSVQWSGGGDTGLTDIQLGTAVPEPSAWAMILVGFCVLGFAGYRRSKEQVALFAPQFTTN